MTIEKRRGLFVAALCLVGLVMLVFNILTPMICDDYRYAFSFATGERLGSAGEILPSLAAHGHVLNGRYAPHFFVQLFTLLPGICFDVVNTAVFLVLVAGLYRLARGAESWDVLLLLGIFGALFLLPPVFGQNMLWMAGSCNYLWPAAVLVWLLKPFADRVCNRDVRIGWPGAALMAAGGFLFGNSSENLSAAGLMLMGLCILWQLIRHRKTGLWMWLTAAAMLAGWLLLMLAPVEKPTVAAEAGFLGMLLERFSELMQLWLTHLGWLTMAFALLVCIGWEKLPSEKLVFAAMAAVSALCCHLAMIVSNYIPERVLLGPMVLMLCACGVLLPGLQQYADALRRGLCLCLCLLAVLNAAMALPKTYNRHQQAKARDQQMMEAAAAGEGDVSTFGIWGHTRYDAYTGLLEMSSDPENFANVAYAAYYGVDSVVVERME